MNAMIRKDLESLSAYATIEKPLPYRLHANESPWDWLKDYRQELQDIVLETAFNHYPEGSSLRVRQALGPYTGAAPENLVMGCGSDELIKMAAEIFLSPGDTAVTHTPTFSEYGVAVRICSGTLHEVPAGPDFEVDIEGIIEAVNRLKAKMVFLCVPNNPTGAIITRQQVLAVLERTEAMVICDEAYYEFCGETVIDRALTEDRLIVLRTLSKAFGLAGLRVGYAVCTEATAECLNRVRMPYNLNSLTQGITCLALKHKDQALSLAAQLCERRQSLFLQLQGIPGLRVFPSGANFLLFRTPRAAEIGSALEAQGVLTRLFSQPVMKDCIRINIGAEETVPMILQAFREVDHENG